MKLFLALFILSVGFTATYAQNEQSPIADASFDYPNWQLKPITGGDKVDLREFTAGKKLVMVVYFAPWCHNWEHDVDFVQSLSEKYAKDGLGIIGVGEYDTVSKMKTHLNLKSITFPTVYESEASSERLNTTHYKLRTEAGDKRKWGSPFYIFLQPEDIQKTGDIVAKKEKIVAGELIKLDVEKWIRSELGLKLETVMSDSK